MKLQMKRTLPLLAALPFSVMAAEPVKISGLMEIEAYTGKNFEQNSVGDILVGKIELGLDSQINERTAMHILLEHEDDDTEPMQLKEGTIIVNLNNGWHLVGGRMILPFGFYESNMIVEPLTVEIGETYEAAIKLGYGGDKGLYGSVYAFRGDTIETATETSGDHNVESYGANIGYLINSGETNLDFGAGYISTIGDSDTVSGALDTTTLDDYVSGIALHATVSNGPWSAVAEYIKSGQFQPGELDFNGQGAQPVATNLEGAYSFAWGTFALSYQTTEEALAVELPEKRIVTAFILDLNEDTTVKIEYINDRDYATDVGGTGEKASNLGVQLAVTF